MSPEQSALPNRTTENFELITHLKPETTVEQRFLQTKMYFGCTLLRKEGRKQSWKEIELRQNWGQHSRFLLLDLTTVVSGTDYQLPLIGLYCTLKQTDITPAITWKTYQQPHKDHKISGTSGHAVNLCSDARSCSDESFNTTTPHA